MQGNLSKELYMLFNFSLGFFYITLVIFVNTSKVFNFRRFYTDCVHAYNVFLGCVSWISYIKFFRVPRHCTL